MEFNLTIPTAPKYKWGEEVVYRDGQTGFIKQIKFTMHGFMYDVENCGEITEGVFEHQIQGHRNFSDPVEMLEDDCE